MKLEWWIDYSVWPGPAEDSGIPIWWGPATDPAFFRDMENVKVVLSRDDKPIVLTEHLGFRYSVHEA